EALAARRLTCVAVSPPIGGRAVKGPADRTLARLGAATPPRHVADCYEGLPDARAAGEAAAEHLGRLVCLPPALPRTLMALAAGLHSLAAATRAAGRAAGDALGCGDDAEARALALGVAAGIVTGRALDAGPLASARALEGMTAVIVNLNRRYKGHAGVRIVGLP